MNKKVIRVAVTGAAGNIAYSLIFRLATGEVFGPDQPIALHLLDTPAGATAMAGVVMEIEDCAYPLLQEVHAGTDPYKIFKEVDYALLVGAQPRGPGMERSDLLGANAEIFIEQGKALNEVASPDAHVLVVGNPCNTNCLIAMHHAPRLKRKNFHAMTRLDENRAVAQLAKKAGVPVSAVTQMTIWGNHSATQVPDVFHARIKGKAVVDVIQDRTWLDGEFISTVQKRGAAIITARGKSSAASAANAIIDAIKALESPTLAGHWFSSAVISDGNSYGVKEGLVFSFPCRSRGHGDYTVVSGLEWNPLIRERIAATEKELLEERDIISSKL